MQETIERWRELPGFEGKYSVSDLGNIRIEFRSHNIHPGTILRVHRDRDGIVRCKLNDGTKSYFKGVHRLVAEAFIGPIPNGMQINHKNGIKDDNRPTNLEIVTPKENVWHGIEVLGRSRSGQANPAAKINEADVVEIREAIKNKVSPAQLAKSFGITREMVRNIATGRAWTNVGGPIAPKGRFMGKVTLTDKQIADIKRRAKKERIADLAKEHGVSRRTIYNYIQGKTRSRKR